MSRWNRWDRYPPAPKKRPPPKHGIRVRTAGTTWWGQRWTEALERISPEYAKRLGRGRTYARQGRVHDLVVHPGEVGARVIGSDITPYRVRIALTRFSDAVWSRAVTAMAAQARYAAELLAGRMPEQIDEVFREARASLFPVQRSDLETDCTCPDWANPCKQVVAAHYVLGDALDRDPFLLFELRGRTKEQVLDALRAERGGGSESESRAGEDSREAEVTGVTLGRLDPATYDEPRQPLPGWSLDFAEPASSGVLVRQLGKPRGWSLDESPDALLGPVIRRAALLARRLAVADAGGEPATKAPRDDETGDAAVTASDEVGPTHSSEGSSASRSRSSRKKKTARKAAPAPRKAAVRIRAGTTLRGKKARHTRSR